MICSGKQTVVFTLLTPRDIGTVDSIVTSLEQKTSVQLNISSGDFRLTANQNPPATAGGTDFMSTETSFLYTETLGFQNDLYIIGGGHCALALSGLMSKMDFHITLFDDRPELNTIAKNDFAHEIKIVDSYERIGDHISSGVSAFVVVMTLGYKTDEIVIRSLVGKEFKYFGVLGSKAKMATMFRELRESGIPSDELDGIRTPVGLPINSRTPEEIAVSIATEIIAVKNGPV
jgi:xanthine dehydrogenase accessory factor